MPNLWEFIAFNQANLLNLAGMNIEVGFSIKRVGNSHIVAEHPKKNFKALIESLKRFLLLRVF